MRRSAWLAATTLYLTGSPAPLAATPSAAPVCRPLPESRREAALDQLGVAAEFRAAFRSKLCEFRFSRRLAILSYSYEAVELTPAWDQPSADPRYPMPVALVDGRPAGRLPEHVPAERPLTVRIVPGRSQSGLATVLCLRAKTAGVGDAPVYPALVWRAGQYVEDARSRACR